MKLLVLIIYNPTEHYKKLLSYWRCYSRSVKDVDVYFIKSTTKYNIPSVRQDKFYGAAEDNLYPSILIKTVEAFKYFKGYDFIYRTNISSFVNLHLLYDICTTLKKEGTYIGFYVGDKCRYASGSGYLISSDIAAFIVEHEASLDYFAWDDMATGTFLNEYYTLDEHESVIIEDDSQTPSQRYNDNIYHYRIKICNDRTLEYKYHEYLIQKIYYPEFLLWPHTVLDEYYELATKVYYDSQNLNVDDIIRGLIRNGKYDKCINHDTPYGFITKPDNYDTYIGDSRPPSNDFELIITRYDKTYINDMPNYDCLDILGSYMVLLKDVDMKNLIGVYVMDGSSKCETRIKKLGLSNIHHQLTESQDYGYYSNRTHMLYIQALRKFYNSQFKYGYFVEHHHLFPVELPNIFKHNNFTYLINNHYGLFVDKKKALDLLSEFDRPFRYWLRNFDINLTFPNLDSEHNTSSLSMECMILNIGAKINIRRILHIFDTLKSIKGDILAKILSSLEYSKYDEIYYLILESKINILAASKIREYLWKYGLRPEYRGLFEIIREILGKGNYAYKYRITSDNWCDDKKKRLNHNIERGTIIETNIIPTNQDTLIWCLLENTYIKLVKI